MSVNWEFDYRPTTIDEMGFLNLYELYRNISIGFVFRMLPNKYLKIVFKFIRKL